VLVQPKIRAATLIAAGQALAPAEAVALMEGVLKAMFRTRFKLKLVALLALVGIGTGFLVLWEFAEPSVYALLLLFEGKEGDDFAGFRRKQIMLLKSRPVLKSALETPELRGYPAIFAKEDPVNWLQKTLMATFLDNTDLLRISVGEGTEHERAALTNAVADAYVAFAFEQEKQSKRERLRTLGGKLDGINEKLNEKRHKILQMGHGMAQDRQERHRFEREDLAGFRKELRQLQLAKIGAQARLNKLKGSDGEQEALGRLQEVAVLIEQERLLKEVMKPKYEIVDEISAMEKEMRDAPLQLEISAAEQIAKRLAGEVEALQLDALHAVPSVRLFQKAESPGQRE